MPRRATREHKKVERFGLGEIRKADRIRLNGSGVRIGTCKRLREALQQEKVETLRQLHRLFFNRLGSKAERLTNILAFNGLEEEHMDESVQKLQNGLSKRSDEEVKLLATLLGVKGATREEQEENLVGYVKKPTKADDDEEVEFVDEEPPEEVDSEELDQLIEQEMEEQEESDELYVGNDDDDEDVFDDNVFDSSEEADKDDSESLDEEEDDDDGPPPDNIIDEPVKKPRQPKTNDGEPPKRGRGRPRKVPKPQEETNPKETKTKEKDDHKKETDKENGGEEMNLEAEVIDGEAMVHESTEPTKDTDLGSQTQDKPNGEEVI